MSTKLEEMVGLLAGRKVDPAILDELADPSSEASRFLEATRARSRALLKQPGETEDFERTRPIRQRGPWRIAPAWPVVGFIILIVSAFGVVDHRFRRLEASLSLRDHEARASGLRFESILNRLAEPGPRSNSPETALKRIEDAVRRLERLEGKPDSAMAELLSVQIRDELAQQRRELSVIEKAETRRLEEIQAAVHDAGRVLRLLLNRTPPLEPTGEPIPGFNPPRPSTGGEPRRGTP
jgi:hypothetical protein